jgi:hypothetical protein
LFSQQVFGVVVVKNCYQIVTGDLQNTTTFNFIDAPEGRDIFLSSTNPLDIDKFEIYHWNDNWEYEGTVNINNYYNLNGQWTYYKITPKKFNGTIEGVPSADVLLVFNKPILKFNNQNTNCVPLNAQNFNLTFPQYDGLCGLKPSFSLKLLNNDPTSGLPFPFSKNFELTDNSFNLNIPTSFCNQQILDLNGNIVSPCLNFEIEIRFTPCEHCPDAEDLIINQPLKICCSCGPPVNYDQD